MADNKRVAGRIHRCEIADMLLFVYHKKAPFYVVYLGRSAHRLLPQVLIIQTPKPCAYMYVCITSEQRVSLT